MLVFYVIFSKDYVVAVIQKPLQLQYFLLVGHMQLSQPIMQMYTSTSNYPVLWISEKRRFLSGLKC